MTDEIVSGNDIRKDFFATKEEVLQKMINIYEKEIKQLKKENEQLKKENEKLRSCLNCKYRTDKKNKMYKKCLQEY